MVAVAVVLGDSIVEMEAAVAPDVVEGGMMMTVMEGVLNCHIIVLASVHRFREAHTSSAGIVSPTAVKTVPWRARRLQDGPSTAAAEGGGGGGWGSGDTILKPRAKMKEGSDLQSLQGVSCYAC